VLGAGIGDDVPSFCEILGMLRHRFVCRSGARQGGATDALRDTVIGVWAEETTTALTCLNIIERKLLTMNRRTPPPKRCQARRAHSLENVSLSEEGNRGG
jgi:hypothetical protein